MKANIDFLNLSKDFWANIRYLSQKIGYTKRNSLCVKIPGIQEIKKTLEKNGLTLDYIFKSNGRATRVGEKILDYFEYRADILNNYAEPRLMNLEKAKKTYEELFKKLNPRCPIPMNKQKGEKKSPAYLTAIINMLIEANANGINCNFDPMELTFFTKNGQLLRTFSRRVDGAFPSVHNPVAIWEIKEYYYTTTFGSRVADGIYETLLDGMEIFDLKETEKINCKHYLMIDSYFTWWNLGRSYLCRIIDLLHMNYLDEILFGYEVIERLPGLVKSWIEIKNKRIN